MVTLRNEEIYRVNGDSFILDIAGALDNCISNGMSYAGLTYMIAAHRHDQLNRNNAALNQNFLPIPFDGTKISIVAFTAGCIIGATAGWGK